MSLKDVIGQEHLIDMLTKSLKEKDFFHAYIFEGPAGIGKRYTAFNFAKGILCNSGTYDACESCISCSKMNHFCHPDYHYIKSEDSIKDRQIEEIQKAMSKKPYTSQNMVFVIDGAETMTKRAQNRLLKTLEEPNKNNIIILLTENLSRILPTVVSRCMTLKFKPLSDEKICFYLKHKYSADNKNIEILAAFSKGRIGMADEMYCSKTFRKRREKSIEIARKMARPDEGFFDLIHELDGEKIDFPFFLDMMEYWYRDIAFVSFVGYHEKILMNVDYPDALLEEANKIGYEKAVKIVEILEEAKKEINLNFNFNMVIKNMLFKIQEE